MRKKQKFNLDPMVFPSGTCVKTEKGYYYLITDGLLKKKFKISNDRVLRSWRFARIIETSYESIGGYSYRSPLPFRDGSLLYDLSTAKMYIVSESKVWHILSPDYLDKIGVTSKDFVCVSNTDIERHTNGGVVS